jgi:hypothetical protein
MTSWVQFVKNFDGSDTVVNMIQQFADITVNLQFSM